ncbi:MAG: map [Dehalococcoidia bacterium]|nr:map [Dehalococcoidia bacterium]
MNEKGIIIKSDREIAVMREAGRLLAEVVAVLVEKARPGITTKELDEIAAKEIKAHKATPSFLGYKDYPAHICVSINDEIVHGIPGPRVMKDGDIVSIDAGLIYKGFQSDHAVTIGLGEISPEGKRLIDTAKQALIVGISKAKAGGRIGDISAAIQGYVEPRGFSVVREYVGHGIGRDLHEDPQIPNYGPAGVGPVLRRGMAIAIEPMVNMGGWRTRVGSDHWTVFTLDGSLAAHFEHTIAITDEGTEVLTTL